MRLRKLILSVLALAPISSIAAAADTQLNEISGEEAAMPGSHRSMPEILKLKRKLFAPHVVKSTLSQAFRYFRSENPTMEVDQAKIEFDRVIQELLDLQLIELDEKEITSGVESLG